MSPETLFYIVLLPITWVLLFAAKHFRARQALMLLVSYLLYAIWGLGFLGLLVMSSLLNYLLGLWLRRQPSATRLCVGVVLNVTILGTFKYLPMTSSLLPHASLRSVFESIILPIGISFWTFQALSYLFDVYRGEDLDPTLVEFLLYIAFWPTVLSGPICRLSDLLPQFRKFANPSADDIRRGLDRICIGLFMTAVGQCLASGIHLGQGLDDAFDKMSRGWTGLDVWCMAIGYGFELFFNFAGYSHIVIGAARLFGFRLIENFACPYASTTPSEFWTRWHMSLSFWIRDYLFLPLAMVRREKGWRSFILILSMVVFGLWHKGTLLFVLWGFYHGLLLVLHREWQQFQRRYEWELARAISEPVSWLVTFSVICLGWIFFRANTVSQAFTMLRAAITPSGYAAHALPSALYIIVFASMSGYFATIATRRLLAEYVGLFALPMEFRAAIYALAVYVGILHAARTQAFIYFQF
jgi:alginate O-acetyltransferase complex protein AlgI